MDRARSVFSRRSKPDPDFSLNFSTFYWCSIEAETQTSSINSFILYQGYILCCCRGGGGWLLGKNNKGKDKEKKSSCGVKHLKKPLFGL